MSTQIDKSETIYLGCECHSPEHIIRVSYFDWANKDPPEIFMELQADRHLNFWNRVRLAVKFIFGTDNLEWHDVIPTHNDISKLKVLIDNYHSDLKLYNEAKILETEITSNG